MDISLAVGSQIERATQDLQRTGVVQGYQAGGTVTVSVDGGTLTLPHLNSYFPRLGDVVQILAVRSGGWLVIGSSVPDVRPDAYGDYLSTIPRAFATSSFEPTTTHLYVTRMYVKDLFNFTKARMVITTAGVGNASVAIYVGQTPNNLILYATQGFPVAPAGTVEASITTGQMFPANPHVALGVRMSSVTTRPFMAASPPAGNTAVLSPTGPLTTSAFKLGSSWPANINMGDGSWTPFSRSLLVTLSE